MVININITDKVHQFKRISWSLQLSTYLFFHFQDGDVSVRESVQAWPSMVGDAAIKRRYSQQHSVPPCSPSLTDSLTQEILENHSSEESSMDKKNLRDSREILARTQYDESDTAIIINDIKHQKWVVKSRNK